MPDVLRQVGLASPEVRGQFLKACQRLAEAEDPTSWDELCAVPGYDPNMPDGTWHMGFGIGCRMAYRIEEAGDIQVIEVYLTE